MLDHLDKLIDIDEVLERHPKALIGSFGSLRTARDKLMGACRARQLAHIPFGRRRLVTEESVLQYLAALGKETWPKDEDKTTLSRSEAGTSPASPDAQTSTGNALTEAQKESVEEALRQRIGQRRSAASRPSSPKTRKAQSRRTRARSS
jgi:hypothetical protein